MYATDGVAWLPTDKFGLTRRPVYTYGFSKPISDTNPSGYVKGNIGDKNVGPPNDDDKAKAFADLNWIDNSTTMPLMAGKAQITGPPIWGVEGDILDITLFNLGFAFQQESWTPTQYTYTAFMHQTTTMEFLKYPSAYQCGGIQVIRHQL